jgi:hypothetical protein
MQLDVVNAVNLPATWIFCPLDVDAYNVILEVDKLPSEAYHAVFFYVSCTIYHMIVNWRKITNKCTGIVYIFLNFIYSSVLNQSSSDAHTHHYTEQYSTIQHVFNILFLILAHDKLELENTDLNNSILKIYTLLSYIVPYNKHPDDG